MVSRDLAQLDPHLPPWRVLYETFSRLEWAGEVRRGYFVNGLAGAQFALPEAVRALSERPPHAASAPALLVPALDPANLYGPAAPLGWTGPPWQRRAGNSLVVLAGRPILAVEAHGKRIRTLPHTSPEEQRQACQVLPDLLLTIHGNVPQSKLTVETWDDQPATTNPARDYLEAAGFVRDYQAMTKYAGWN